MVKVATDRGKFTDRRASPRPNQWYLLSLLQPRVGGLSMLHDPHTSQETADLAVTRTLLAVERTFNAWIKTALGFLAGGLGLVTLMGEHLAGIHGILIVGASVILMLLAILITAWSTAHFRRRMRSLGQPAPGQGAGRLAIVVTGGVLVVCAIALLCLWLLK